MEELAASGACDVLAHPDLIKVAGYVPDAPAEWWDRIAEAAVASGMAAEVSSAGWRKPVGEQYPALGLLERFVARGCRSPPLRTPTGSSTWPTGPTTCGPLLAAGGRGHPAGRTAARAAYPVPVSRARRAAGA